jgi:FKBP-type peptidyl-prolyl cis-trans isomerase
MSKTSFQFLFYSFLILSFLGLASCGKDDDNNQDLDVYISRYAPTAQKTASGLYYTIDSPGASVKVKSADFVTINFRQFDLNNAEVANSYQSGYPIAIAVSELFDGLQEGLEFLGVGGKGKFVVPSNLTNGFIQTGGIVYEIELLNIYESLVDYNDVVIAEYLTAKGITATRTSDGVYYVIEAPGVDPKPVITSTVTVDYSGYLLNDSVFDSSLERGSPSTFTLSGLIEGWQKGLQLFGESGKGKLFIPSYLAYGGAGNSVIPPNYPIAFDITLIDVQ